MAEKTALDMVFLYVFTERYHLITVDLVYLASGEWQHVWKYVKPLKHETYVDESKITKFLEATADSLQSKSWYYTKRVGIEAEAQYNKLRKLVSIAIIKPYLVSNITSKYVFIFCIGYFMFLLTLVYACRKW
jgi:hypothetical protein